MAHTNSTANYNLPQFISTDKPAWLTDVNAAYADIDVGMKNAQDAATSAQTDATQALTDSAAAMSTATQADAKASGAIASFAATFSDTSTYSVGDYVIYNNILYKCTVAVTVPGPWSGTLNWERATVDSIATSLKDSISNINIEDLANVILTTSDNNKILIVNVNDGNITVSAIGNINGTINVESGWTENANVLKKWGNICEVYFAITGGTLIDGWNTVGTLPSGFIPTDSIDFVGLDNRNSTGCQAKITSSGNIQVYKSASLSNNIRLYITFLID